MGVESSMKKKKIAPKYLPTKKNYVLPTIGISDELLKEQISSYKQQDENRWKDGQVSGGIYHGGEEHLALQNHALSMFSVSNPLHGDVWPSIVKMEAEIISMTANLVNGGDLNVCGAITSGGTESIIMSVKTHRMWAEARGITEPTIIGCFSSHAGLDKACDMLKVKLVKVPFDLDTCEMLVDEVAKRITKNTIMIYSSAPNYPHGIIDPIKSLSDLVMQQPFNRPIGLHVDCCLGGFFLPFARKLRDNIPAFDFALPGVTSMSCDTHKYGYASKGTSVVLFRNQSYREHMFFTFPNWTGGMYSTPTMPGSRPGALSAAAWASMMRLGEQGYLDITEKILSCVERITAAARHDIPGLIVLGDPISMVVAVASTDFNIFTFGKKMRERGYGWSACQNPSCVHLAATLLHTSHTESIICAMKEVAVELMSTKDVADNTKIGIYGVQDNSGSVGGQNKVAGMRRYQAKMLDMPKAKKNKNNDV